MIKARRVDDHSVELKATIHAIDEDGIGYTATFEAFFSQFSKRKELREMPGTRYASSGTTNWPEGVCRAMWQAARQALFLRRP